MKWDRVSAYGMQCGEYRVAKCFIDGCTLYVIYYKHDQLKVCNDFDECKEVAKEHKRNLK